MVQNPEITTSTVNDRNPNVRNPNNAEIVKTGVRISDNILHPKSERNVRISNVD